MELSVEVRKALSCAFPDLPIYAETVYQGFRTPCFFVRALSEDRRRELGRRWRRSAVFEIRYHSASIDEDLFREIGARLTECFARLPDSGAAGRKMGYKTNEKGLTFTVQYSFCAFESETDASAMGTVYETVSLGG